MSDLTYPHTLVPGTPENVQDVEDNFQAIKAKVNGGITLENLAAEIQQLLVPTGFLMSAARQSAPNAGWLICDGASYPRSSYAALAGVIGSAYGGDAVNFNVPDLRGRMAVGKGTHLDVDNLGDSEGSALADRRPKHKTSIADPGHDHTVHYVYGPGGAIGNLPYYENQAGHQFDTFVHTDGAGTGISAGPQTAGTPVDVVPFVVIVYFIKT
jgi:microcystin-dependent protein